MLETETNYVIRPLDLQSFLNLIPTLIDKGRIAELKQSEHFINTLKDTKVILQTNLKYLEEMKNDKNYNKVLTELSVKLQDLENKMSKLSLIKLCRDKAEKYLGQVTDSLYNINLVLASMLSKKPDNNNKDYEYFNEQMKILNQRIEYLQNELNKKNQEVPKENPEAELLEGMAYYLGLNGRINYKKAYECFIIAEKKGHVYAKILLAQMYEKGKYVDTNLTKAYNYYQQASELGNGVGSFMVAQYLESRIHPELPANSKDNAFGFYMKASEQNNTDATTRCALAYEENTFRTIEKDPKKALDLLKVAINKDENPTADNHLGSLFYNGTIVTQNHKVAAEHFERAAKHGNLDAMNNIGICFELGHGVPRSSDKAIEYYKKAGSRDHPQAIANHGILLIKQNHKDDKNIYFEAERLLSRSVHIDQNQKDANYYLGYLYENGFGVPENQYIAYIHYKKALELNHLKAMTKVGLVLFNGVEKYVEKNIPKAIELWKEAAKKGENEALNFMGLLYEKGNEYVEKDEDKVRDNFNFLGYSML